MTWTKTGDEFADECWTLSDAAYRLHHEGLTWSNRKQTAGRLDKDEMLRWAKRPGAADELVAIGWWEDHGDHYQLIHHLGYQRTPEQVARQSIVNAQNRAKGKARPVRKKESSDESSDEPSDERDRTGQDRPGEEATSAAKKTTTSRSILMSGNPGSGATLIRCGTSDV
jgi:hypothetical protein